MTAFDSILVQALALPKEEREWLIQDLLASDDSVPLQSDDDGVAEALRRLEEGKRDPSVWLSHEEFLAGVRGLRKPKSATLP